MIYVAPKKADIAVVYRVNGTLDISVRNMGVRPRLGMSNPERQWEYVVKYQGTIMFRGTDLYTDSDLTHQYAAAQLLRYFVPKDDDMSSLPWIDVQEIAKSPSRAGWFIANYKPFADIHWMDTITEFVDVHAVLGDGSTAPFGEGGLAVYGDHLDDYRELLEVQRQVKERAESMAAHPSNGDILTVANDDVNLDGFFAS